MNRVKIFRLSDFSTASIRRTADQACTDYSILYTRSTDFRFVEFGLERMLQVADDCGAAMVYADHFNGELPCPVTEYQLGSVRDDFDFGGLLLVRSAAMKEAVSSMDADYAYGGLYDLRLRLSRIGSIVHIGEFLYYEIDTDGRASGDKQFDYVNPRNREVQIEMEAICTAHLKAIGAWLKPVFRDVDLSEGDFPVEASVVIPCRNRVSTIADALRSALSQKTDFPYNVFVVDDNSDDGTVEVIKGFLDDPKLIYIAQPKSWHGIGGNWNAAVHHPQCGRFALQLDSDDVYSSENTVQAFVDAFRSQNCAMVIGSYEITDIDLKPLPPGKIDHREWTEENGRNNALRINGLGAPRGFWTPLLRRVNFPPTKYGEDYAVGLRISREYRIGRIWDTLYYCRRWGGNSDSALPQETLNRYNFYKDSLRSHEIEARIARNRK
ncbi:MAG: glycosyltransferase [Bacteroidales bacterium]|nr:glycosyltransferase [Bacteroidales bacterium]